MDLKEIKQIVEMMKRNDLSYFNIHSGDFKLKLRRGVEAEVIAEAIANARSAAAAHQHAPAPQPPAVPVAAPVAAAAPPHAAPAPAAEADPGQTINSPMVGTFYRSSSPGSPAFVKVGDQVDEDTVVCIIEAMKVMNEIKAEAKGTITKLISEDGKPVQYGEHLFAIEP